MTVDDYFTLHSIRDLEDAVREQLMSDSRHTVLEVEVAALRKQNAPEYVSALAVARALKIPFSQAYKFMINGRKLVTTQEIDGVDDFVIAVRDIRYIAAIENQTECPQRVNSRQKHSSDKDLLGRAADVYLQNKSLDLALAYLRDSAAKSMPVSMVDQLCLFFAQLYEDEDVGYEIIRWRNANLYMGDPSETYDMFYFAIKDEKRRTSLQEDLLRHIKDSCFPVNCVGIKHQAGSRAYVTKKEVSPIESPECFVFVREAQNNVIIRIPNNARGLPIPSTLHDNVRNFCVGMYKEADKFSEMTYSGTFKNN